MRIRTLPLVLAGALAAVWTAAPCSADILTTRDGKVLPKGVQLPRGEAPGLGLLEESKDKKIDPLAYDSVKIGGVDVPPGMVDEVWLLACETSQAYTEGARAASGDLYTEAAASFGAAADELGKGNARQLCLYHQANMLAAAGDVEGMVAAIDTLVAEFPKTFFLPELQMRKARVLKGQGKADDAVAALQMVINAPGMNRRGLHEAELLKIYLTQVVEAGRDTARWAQVEAAYRERLGAIEKDAAARAELEQARLRAIVGIGKALAAQGKVPEAKTMLEQVAAAPESATTREILGGAYAGLGDVLFSEAREAQTTAKGNPEQKKRASDLLDRALLHYLRVTELYADQADPSDLLNARSNAARVFSSQFQLSEDKDLESAMNAMRFFKAAYDMLPAGPAQSQLAKEFRDVKTRREKAEAALKAASAPK